MRHAMAGQFMSPLEWAREMMRSFTPGEASTQAEHQDASPGESPDLDAATQERNETVDELRRQLAELTGKIDSLSSASPPNPPRP